MCDVMTQMHNNPGDIALADVEIKAVHQYHVKHGIYMDFLRQKSKSNWIRAGDENITLFHQSIKARISHTQVYIVHDVHGNYIDNPEEVPGAFLSFYNELLGSTFPQQNSEIQTDNSRGASVNDHHRDILNAPYTRDEVQKALFSIPGTNAPGLDGFRTLFYKDSWDVIGDNVIDVVLDVLQNGRLLYELNHTIVPLIPKTKC